MMSQETPAKTKVTIPVVISRTGEIHTGFFMRKIDGTTEQDHDGAIDCFEDESYKAGYVVVYIEAEIDEAPIWEKFTAAGTVIVPTP